MSSFVETATLRVVDQSSAPLNKIAAAVHRVEAATRKLAGLNTGKGASGLGRYAAQAGRATSQVNRLAASMAKLNKPARVTVSVNAGAAHNSLNSLQAKIRKLAQPVRVPVTTTGGLGKFAGGGRAGPGLVPSAALAGSRRGGGGGFGGFGGRDYGDARDEIKSGMRYAMVYGAIGAARTAMRAAGRGVVTEDSVRAAIETQGLDDRTKNLVTASADAAASKYLTISRADALELARQSIPTMQTAGKTAEEIDTMASAIVETQTRVAAVLAQNAGGDADAGREGARQLFRAADVEGLTTDAKKLDTFMSASAKMGFVKGTDFDPNMLATNYARLKGFGLGFDQNAVFDMASVQDELRGSTADAFRSFMSDMTRSNLAQGNKDAMVAAGLRDYNGLMPDGASAAMHANPIDYINKTLKPIVEKTMGRTVESFGGDDAARTGAIRNALAKIGYLQKSSQLPLAVLTKIDEIMRDRKLADQVKTDPAYVRELHRASIASALDSITQKWSDSAYSALGTTGTGLIKDGLGFVAEKLNKTQSDTFSPARLLAAAGVGAGAWAVTNPGALASIAAAGRAGWVLSRAGGALTGAAQALSAAAARLAAGSMTSKAGGLAGAAAAGAAGAVAGAEGAAAGAAAGGIAAKAKALASRVKALAASSMRVAARGFNAWLIASAAEFVGDLFKTDTSEITDKAKKAAADAQNDSIGKWSRILGGVGAGAYFGAKFGPLGAAIGALIGGAATAAVEFKDQIRAYLAEAMAKVDAAKAQVEKALTEQQNKRTQDQAAGRATFNPRGAPIAQSYAPDPKRHEPMLRRGRAETDRDFAQAVKQWSESVDRSRRPGGALAATSLAPPPAREPVIRRGRLETAADVNTALERIAASAADRAINGGSVMISGANVQFADDPSRSLWSKIGDMLPWAQPRGVQSPTDVPGVSRVGTDAASVFGAQLPNTINVPGGVVNADGSNINLGDIANRLSGFGPPMPEAGQFNVPDALSGFDPTTMGPIPVDTSVFDRMISVDPSPLYGVGPQIGSSAAGAMNPGGIGAQIGAAAAAQIRAATAQVTISVQHSGGGGNGAPTGTNPQAQGA